MTEDQTKYVRISVPDLEKLKDAAKELIRVRQELALLTIELDNSRRLNLANDPKNRTTQHNHLKLNPGATVKELQDLVAAVELPSINEPSSPSSSHRSTPYGPIWALAIEAVEAVATPTDRAQGKVTIPHALTPAKVDLILNAIERGVSRTASFGLAGIPIRYQDVYRAKAKLQLEPYQTLFDLMEIAEARNETTLVQRWEHHTRDSWQAGAQLLSRRFPNRWGDKRTLELTLTELLEMPTEKLAEVIGPEAREWLEATLTDSDDQSTYATLDPTEDYGSNEP